MFGSALWLLATSSLVLGPLILYSVAKVGIAATLILLISGCASLIALATVVLKTKLCNKTGTDEALARTDSSKWVSVRRSVVLVSIALASATAVGCVPHPPIPLRGVERERAVAAYLEHIKSQVARHWDPKGAVGGPPASNAALSGGRYVTLISITVDEMGIVHSASVGKVSGAPKHALFDKAAKSAVLAAGPFDPPPRGLLYRREPVKKSRGYIATLHLLFTVNVPRPGKPLPKKKLALPIIRFHDLVGGVGDMASKPAELEYTFTVNSAGTQASRSP